MIILLEELIKYEFNNKKLTDEVLSINPSLAIIGDSFINGYVSFKLNKEFTYYDDEIKSYFDLDLLTSVKNKLLSNDYLTDRVIKLHINELSNNNDKYYDLFKALIGAYLIDNANIDYDYIDYLLNIDDAILLNIENEKNYYKHVYSWNKNKYKEAPKCTINIDNNKYMCNIVLNEINEEFKASSQSKYLAIIEASKCAYKYLEDNSLLLKMEDIVGYPDIDKCVNQLQELFVKGFINEPQYKIAMKGSNNGIDIWKCRILIDGYKESFSSEDTSKKTAKRNAAFQMLKYIMEEK